MIAAPPLRAASRFRPRDPILLASQLLLAAALALAAALTVRNGFLFAFPDAPSHVLTARRVFDNGDASLAQLGTHWAPLFHLLQLPLVWIDPVYRTGASGVLVSALASMTTGFFLYRLVLLVGGTRPQAFVSAALLAASPSFLYSGVVPMLPAMIMATTTANVYFLTRWALTRSGPALLAAGLALSLATLTHFDTWILAPIELAIVILVARSSWRQRARTEATTILWLVAASYGIGLFLLINVLISGRPLAFLSQPSGGAFADEPVVANRSLSALADYPRAAWLNAGPALAVMGMLGLLIYVVSRRRDPHRLVPLLLLYPFAWYTFQAATVGSYMDPASFPGGWDNLRYGTAIMPAVAFFAAIGSRRLLPLLAVVALVSVSAGLMIRNREVAAWEDARYDVPVDGTVRDAATWLGDRADDSKIFIPTFHGAMDRFEFFSGLPSNSFVDVNDSHLYDDVRASPSGDLSRFGIGWVVWLGEQPTRSIAQLNRANGGRLCYVARTSDLELSVLRIYSFGEPCGGRVEIG